jgi:NAD(P)-dependent dehydrogenase (short-subunit alcohol dehydrogenase family)
VDRFAGKVAVVVGGGKRHRGGQRPPPGHRGSDTSWWRTSTPRRPHGSPSPSVPAAPPRSRWRAISPTKDSVDEALRGSRPGAFGGVDLLHNVAADLSPGTIGRDTDLLDVDLAVWDRTLLVDLRGYVLTMRAAIPMMLARGGGAIVNTSSAAAFVGEATRPAYAAAKAGINAVSRHVANRWGREGIRCNVVAPGLVLTETADRRCRRRPLPTAGAEPVGAPRHARGHRGLGGLPAVVRCRLHKRAGDLCRRRDHDALNAGFAQESFPRRVTMESSGSSELTQVVSS